MRNDEARQLESFCVAGLGLDVGSVGLHAAVLDRRGDVRISFTFPLKGNPQAALALAFERLLPLVEDEPVAVGITGTGRDVLGSIRGAHFENEIIATALASTRLAPWARCLVEVGGHYSKWVLLGEGGEVLDFSLNELCAAGSGAFLEQQASRLGLSAAELASLAAGAPAGAAVAGRCSVFAKSDMIHLQQKGTPLDEIAYGVCLAFARNYAATVLKGRDLVRPAALIGGAAANPGLLRALREVLSLEDADLVAPEGHEVFGAVGAALSAAARDASTFTLKALSGLVLKNLDSTLRVPATLDRLPEPKIPNSRTETVFGSDAIEGEVFLGIDVGSVSTDFALIDRECSVLAGVYLPTRGRPIAAMEEGLAALKKRTNSRTTVRAAVATGSGRHLAVRFLDADAAHNEITAQLRSAIHYFPDVDTVFEIGGQDSKYISVRDSALGDFAMNKVCAAGTGSFLEEQAIGLGLEIIGGFEKRAFKSDSPIDLGSRCTVFMDTELVHALQQGIPVDDIAAGLAYSIARNYIEKVVANRPVGKTVVFQGGVASNRAVVAAFSQILGREVHVHPFNRLSGAIGAALLAREAYLKEGYQTAFVGFDGYSDYNLSSFECRHCSNMCQVTKIGRDGKTAFFGDVCERYTSGLPSGKTDDRVQDLCEAREIILARCLEGSKDESNIARQPTAIEKLLGRTAARILEFGNTNTTAAGGTARGSIGIPRASLYFELFPLWASMFNSLGYDVIVSAPSSKELLAKGVRKVSSEACLPVKLAYSHTQDLLGRNPDYIFLPSILDLPAPFGSPETCTTCPYTQSLPFMIRSAVRARFLTPQINMAVEMKGMPEGLEALADPLGVERKKLRAAYQAGKETFFEFKAALLRKGREVLDSQFDWAVVLIGKPYNIYDSFLNLNLVRHLARMGITAIPYEFIPGLRTDGLDDSWDSLPWRFNRDYIKVALAACRDERLYPIVVSNFGCGPDAFTLKHLERILAGKPTLFLEFDEHRGEAGLVTRLEAFVDEVTGRLGKRSAIPPHQDATSRAGPKLSEGKFFIPNFSDHAYAYAAALRYVGAEAEVLPPPDGEVRRKGEQFCSGKECHPYGIIAGDLVRLVESRSESDPPCRFFFPGTSVPCLLTQYGAGCRLILDQMKADGVQVITPTARGFYELLGLQGGVRLWRGLTAMDLLVKASSELRPYETEKGSVEAIHRINCRELEKAVEGGDIVKTTKECIERLLQAEIDVDARRRLDRPVVGIAGDIYTRANRLANQNLVGLLEEFGCEVWPSPFIVDVIDFGLKMGFERSLYRRDISACFQNGWFLALKELSEQSVTKLFRERFTRAQEPSYREVVEIAAPYVGDRAGEVLMLNVAKMVDFAAKGADGIVNAMCLNCMVGTVSAALMSKIRENHDNIPAVNLVFGGTEGTSQSLRLEAFIHQVKEHAKQKRAGRNA